MSEISQRVNQALLNIEQPNFDSTGIVGKDRKYPYASLKECMRVVKEVCKPLGLSVYHDTETREGTDYVFTVIADGQDSIARCPIPVDLSGRSQDKGSAITYAKRYSLCAAFGLVAEEDDDGAQDQAQPKRTAKKATKQEKPKSSEYNEAVTRMLNAIGRYCDDHGLDIETVKQDVKRRQDFENTADFYNKVAYEFETA